MPGPPLDPPLEAPGPARRWPAVLIAVATLGVLAAAVVFAVTRDGSTDASASGPTTTVPTRACVQPPRTTTSTGPQPVGEAPDGTFLGSISPESATTVTLTILTPGSQPITGVPIGPAVTPPTSPTGGAVTVRDGVIVEVDPTRVSWDDDLGRGDRPCTPDTGCRRTDVEPPHSWPYGVDGDLGSTISDVPRELASGLAKWGIEVDPLAMRLGPSDCTLVLTIGQLAAVAEMALLDDGTYVLSAVSSDVDGAVPIVDIVGAEGTEGSEAADVAVELSADAATAHPTAIVDLAVRVGDRTVRGQAPSTATQVTATVPGRTTFDGSYVLAYSDPDGSVRRLVAAQLPG